DVRYQNIDFQGASRFGVAGGLTYRLHVDKTQPDGRYRNAIELHLGYMHAFIASQKNDDRFGPGLAGTSGTACFPAANNRPGETCSNGAPKYRTNWPVNLGTI